MRLYIILLLIIFYCSTSAQELLMPVIPENDSLISDTSRQYLYNNPVPAELFLLNRFVQLQDFNFDFELTKRRNYFINNLSAGNFFGFSPGVAFSPFISSGSVFSGANYKIGEKISLGGFSYGGNSIFTAPFPNQGPDNFDFRGSTLFMEYKVSENFKIGTSISVTRSPGY